MKVFILRAQGYALVADHRFPIFWSLAVLPQLPLLRRWIANEGFFIRISYYYYITSIKDYYYIATIIVTTYYHNYDYYIRT